MEELVLVRDSAALLRILAAGGGEAAAAWSELVERHGAHLWGICWRVAGERQVTEDACQEAWLQVRARAGQFRGSGADADAAARGWLAQIAARSALLLLRRRQRARRHETVLGDGPAPAVADADAPPAEAHQLVSHALTALRAHDRIPLELHFLAGFDHRQLAATLGCTPLAARVRVHRALGRLRQRLGRSGVALGVAALTAQLQAAEATPALPGGALRYWQGLSSSALKPTLATTGLISGIATMTTLSLASVAAAAVLACAVVRLGGAVETTTTVTTTTDGSGATTVSIASGGGQTVTTATPAGQGGGITNVTASSTTTSGRSDSTSTVSAGGQTVKVERHRDGQGPETVTVTANGQPVQPETTANGRQQVTVNGQVFVIDSHGVRSADANATAPKPTPAPAAPQSSNGF